MFICHNLPAESAYSLLDRIDYAPLLLCVENVLQTFLSAPGLDFCFPLPTRLEASKYFLRDPAKSDALHLGWVQWRPGGMSSPHR